MIVFAGAATAAHFIEGHAQVVVKVDGLGEAAFAGIKENKPPRGTEWLAEQNHVASNMNYSLGTQFTDARLKYYKERAKNCF